MNTFSGVEKVPPPASTAEVFGGSATVLEELTIFSLGRLLVLLWGTYCVYNGTTGCVCVCVCVCVRAPLRGLLAVVAHLNK